MFQILSIGIIAYNEEKYLPNLLEDMKAQKYPHSQIEILLIDSCSTDGTKAIMEKFKRDNSDFYGVQVLENSRKNQPAGWNVAITHFNGDVLARIDGHSKVSPEYSLYVMEDIRRGENIVGGIRPAIIEKDTPWANVLLQLENSLFGSNINPSRRSSKESYVKTMFHAAYRREVFEQVGFFNETLPRTEDNEFHYRVRKNGYKLFYDPRIVSYQYARSSFTHMVKQKFNNGYWIGVTIKTCPGCISFYHLIPFTFICAIAVTTCLAIAGTWQLSALLLGVYGLFAVINTIFCGIQNGFYLQHIVMPVLFLILHTSYGIGTVCGVIRLLGKSEQ